MKNVFLFRLILNSVCQKTINYYEMRDFGRAFSFFEAK